MKSMPNWINKRDLALAALVVGLCLGTGAAAQGMDKPGQDAGAGRVYGPGCFQTGQALPGGLAGPRRKPGGGSPGG